jgi:hypothetical protein
MARAGAPTSISRNSEIAEQRSQTALVAATLQLFHESEVVLGVPSRH